MPLRRAGLAVLLTLVGSSLALEPSVVLAQDAEDDGRVQILTGRIFAGGRVVYSLRDLEPAHTLSVRAENLFGNLDPIIFLLDGSSMIRQLLMNVAAQLAQVREAEGSNDRSG